MNRHTALNRSANEPLYTHHNSSPEAEGRKGGTPFIASAKEGTPFVASAKEGTPFIASAKEGHHPAPTGDKRIIQPDEKGKRAMKSNMRLQEILRPPRDERGVALLIALAVLVLMAILAVSFYTSQDIESKAASNARAARSAEAIAEGGLEWAIALVESDETLGTDTNFDIWGPRAHETGGYNDDVLFNNGNNNEVDLTELFPDPADLDHPYDARWIYVRDGARVIGRFAAIIECENGKANVNVVGNGKQTDIDNSGQAEGISPAEISLYNILDEITDADPAWADDIIDLRNGPDGKPGIAGGPGGDDDGDGPAGYVFCDDNLNGKPDPEDYQDAMNEPDEHNVHDPTGDDIVLLDLSTVRKYSSMTAANLTTIRAYITVNSQTQNVYKLEPANDSVTDDWAAKLCVNTATAIQIQTELQKLQVAGRLPATAKLNQITANILDFIDNNDDITQFGGTYGIEKTPYINEVEASPQTYPINLGGGVTGTVYDHGEFVELINPYDVPINVNLDVPMQGDIGGTGSGPRQLIHNISVPARSGETPGFFVIGDTSGYYTYTDPDTEELKKVTFDDPTAPRPGGCDMYKNLGLGDGGGTILLQASSGGPIENAVYTGAGSRDNRTSQKDDPRVGDWFGTFTASPGAENGAWNPDASGDMDLGLTLSERFLIYNGKVGSVGHLGRVHAGQQWATIDLTGDDLPGGNWDTLHEEKTWLNIYDVFTTAENVENHRYGLININTAPEEVLMGLKDVDASRIVADRDPPTSRVFESVAEIGEYLPIEAQGTAKTWIREKHLADVAGLVTVRSHVFRVTVLAQALDRQGNKTAERRLEASVLRTINTAGSPSVRVLSMRWLFED